MKVFGIEGRTIECTGSNEAKQQNKPLVEKRKSYEKLTKARLLTGCAGFIAIVALIVLNNSESRDISPIIEPGAIVRQNVEVSEITNDDVITETNLLPIEDEIVEEATVYEAEIYVEEPLVEVINDAALETDISELYRAEIEYIAKTVYGEARGNTKTEQAAVIWTILNRVDSDLQYMPDDIISVITQEYQYLGYNPKHPVDDDLVELAKDVLTRWTMEKNGETNVGRVLPKDYLWFYGDGKHNYFTNEWRSGNNWDWSLKSPY